uniref:Ankyrin repeat domain-containing protein 13B n=1 Tax=Acrobeloides nanus TaxID=290746 RepID=A0A914C4W6_9BILA
MEMLFFNRNQINSLDPHGRTPCHLATILGYVECAELLLEQGADANTQDKEMWLLSHDAVCLANPPFLAKLLAYRDYQRALQSNEMMKTLYESLQNSDDFYVEMAWSFESWLPFVKNMCPSDTYKIYKSGTNIRIDTSLLGFDNTSSSSSNGRQTFIFRFSNKENAEIIFIDHSQCSAHIQAISSSSPPVFEHFSVPEEVIAEKLLSPVTTTYINVDNVGFERSKSFGLFSWIGSNAKEEDIEGYTAKVFNASNLEVVTKTRVEHLRDEDKWKNSRDFGSKPVSFLMGLFEKKSENSRENSPADTSGITMAQYLQDETGQTSSRIGRPRQEVVRKNSFNASLWLADSFPLKLQDQIFPIIDLMAIRNSNFSRLKSFIQLQLPSGFPVQINIPLFHMINAKVTFRNVNEPEPTALKQEIGSTASAFPLFELDPSVFEIPASYSTFNATSSLFFEQPERATSATSVSDAAAAAHRFGAVDLDDEYVYLLERFMNEDETGSPIYRSQLQQAIEESLVISSGAVNPVRESTPENEVDIELVQALELSKAEEEKRLEEARRLEQEEDEELRRALELSLIEQ